MTAKKYPRPDMHKGDEVNYNPDLCNQLRHEVTALRRENAYLKQLLTNMAATAEQLTRQQLVTMVEQHGDMATAYNFAEGKIARAE